MRTISETQPYTYLDRDNNPKTVIVSQYTAYYWDRKRGKDSLAKFLHDLESCQTMQEIGDKWGMTRERVRQLLLKIHNKRGRARQRACTISRHSMNTKYSETSLWALNKIQEKGFIVKASLNKNFFPLKRLVSINHKPWSLWYCENRHHPNPNQRKSSYSHIGTCGQKASNRIITRYNHVTKERELFIIPKKYGKPWGMFIPFVESDYRGVKKSPWLAFKNAWEHLG